MRHVSSVRREKRNCAVCAVAHGAERGSSLIDVLIALGIIVILFGGIYLVYFTLGNAASTVESKTAASAILAQEEETIRNLPYDSVGTIGGIPSGTIPPQQTVTFGNFIFVVHTTIHNIDDPFDGVLGGTPNDTSPADYKTAEIQVTCSTCARFVPLSLTMTVAPKNLETASTQGSLFVNIIDASGNGIPQASVNITNASVTPSINLNDVTNNSGTLQLVGVPSSTQAYHIVVGKTGFAVSQTYPPGGAGNPNPINPDATVSPQTLTILTLQIERLSQLNVSAADMFCKAIPNRTFNIQGAQLIGTPNILKYATTTTTGAPGAATLLVEGADTYTLTLGGSSYDPLGTIPLSPLTVSPSSTVSFAFVLVPSNPSSLLVTVKDATSSSGIANAAVTLSKTGFSQTQTTGHNFISQSDWSGGAYSSQSGGIDASTPGALALLANASGTYTTSTVSWLISNTFDLGTASTTFFGFASSPLSQPGGAVAQFQLAASNDQVTWNFVGPDGTPATYFRPNATTTPAVLNGNRYFRYQVFLLTQNGSVTPTVRSVQAEFSSSCVPPYQTLFNGLSAGSYLLDVTAAGHAETTSTVSATGPFTTSTVFMP